MCARVCPTETLCEEACVREAAEGKPVKIGELQRYATDVLMDDRPAAVRSARRSTGKRVAVVGGGPAGLSCAHRLAMHGHDVVIFDARPKIGGLNEYGIAAYKTVDGFAAREVDFILSIGGINVETGKALGRDFTLGELKEDFDAVFLAIGLGGVNALGLSGEDMAGVEDAVDYIAGLRQAKDLASAAGRPPRRGGRRRHDRHRHRLPVEAPRRRGGHHRLSPRPRAHGRQRIRARARPDRRRHHQVQRHAEAAARRRRPRRRRRVRIHRR